MSRTTQTALTFPSETRIALVLFCLAGCGGTIPAETRAGEAGPVALAIEALPAATPAPEMSPAPMPFVAEPEVEVVAMTPPAGVDIAVRAGENLAGLASVSGLSIEEIVDANGLDPLAGLQPGDVLRIPVTGNEAHAFSETRDFARADRLDHYLSGRGGLVGVESHRVRTGETAWAIAREQAGVPNWVLSSFNPETDMDQLGIGQRLKVPVFGDSVAEVTLDAGDEMNGELEMSGDAVGEMGSFEVHEGPWGLVSE
jgi:LysM repeat protein